MPEALSPMTPEEKALVRALVLSPGWSLLLKQLFIPEMRRALHQIEQPGNDFSDTQLWRGMKLQLTHILKFCYGQAALPDPFEEYSQMFLASLNLPPSLAKDAVEEENTQNESRVRRTSYPAL